MLPDKEEMAASKEVKNVPDAPADKVSEDTLDAPAEEQNDSTANAENGADSVVAPAPIKDESDKK